MAIRGTQVALVGGLLGIVGAVAYVLSGSGDVQQTANRQLSFISWPVGGKPPNNQIVCAQGRADCSPRCMAFLRLDAGAGEWGEVLFRSCGTEWDGGDIPDLAETIAEEFQFDRSMVREVAYDGGPRFVATIKTEADKDWPCACAPPGGTNCERMNNAGAWVSTAGWNNVINESRWRGAGCIRMPCERKFGGPSNKPAGCQ